MLSHLGRADTYKLILIGKLCSAICFGFWVNYELKSVENVGSFFFHSLNYTSLWLMMWSMKCESCSWMRGWMSKFCWSWKRYMIPLLCFIFLWTLTIGGKIRADSSLFSHEGSKPLNEHFQVCRNPLFFISSFSPIHISAMGKQTTAVKGSGGLLYWGADGSAGCTATAAAGPTGSAGGPANAGPASHPASAATTARLANTDKVTLWR